VVGGKRPSSPKEDAIVSEKKKKNFAVLYWERGHIQKKTPGKA